MDRLVRNLAGTLTLLLRDDDGNLVDATGNVTITVKDSAGTTVVSGTATKTPATTGTYTFSVSAANNAVLDTYVASWAALVAGQANTYSTRYEVVGAHLFSVADLRDWDTTLTAAKYPGDKVRKARDEATEQLERPGRTHGSLRGRRLSVDGTGTDTLHLPHMLVGSVASVKVDGVTLSTSNVKAYADGRLVLTSGVWSYGQRNVSVLYEAGYSEVPRPLATAAMILARERLVQGTSEGSMRATAAITDQIAYRLTIPGRDGWTGIPIVDESIRQWLYPVGS